MDFKEKKTDVNWIHLAHDSTGAVILIINNFFLVKRAEISSQFD